MYMFYIYLDLHDTLSDPQHTQKLGKITKSSKERRTTHSNVSWSSLGSWFALKYELNVSDRHHEQIQKQRRSSGWRQKGWLWFLSVGANTQTTCAKPPTNPEKALHDRRVTVVIIQRHKNQKHKKFVKKKKSSCTSSWAGLVYIPVEGGDRLRRDASQKIKDRSTNKGAGSERPPFLPVISLALHNIVLWMCSRWNQT